MAEDLLTQVAFLSRKNGRGIPIAVSIPQVERGVWQASAEIGCSHPGVMWTGPHRTSNSEAHNDRARFIEEQLAEGGLLPGGTVDYTPLDALPSLWVEASIARLQQL